LGNLLQAMNAALHICVRTDIVFQKNTCWNPPTHK